MDAKDKVFVKTSIQVMISQAYELQKRSPDEQAFVGSELFKIVYLLNLLEEKYLADKGE